MRLCARVMQYFYGKPMGEDLFDCKLTSEHILALQSEWQSRNFEENVLMYEFAILWVGVEVYLWETLPFYWSIFNLVTANLNWSIDWYFGQLLNMAIWRVPRGESIFLPRSHCPGVRKHALSPLDLLPILSYLLLKRTMSLLWNKKFGIRYVLIEIFLALAFADCLSNIWSLNPIFVAIATFLALIIFC